MATRLLIGGLAITYPALPSANPSDPVSAALEVALNAAARHCAFEAYPAAAMTWPQQGHVTPTARVTVGPAGISVVVRSIPEQRRDAAVWDRGRLGGCLQRQLAAVISPRPRATVTRDVAIAPPLPYMLGARQLDLFTAEIYLEQRLGSAVARCGAKTERFMTLEVAPSGRVVRVESDVSDASSACLARTAEQLIFPTSDAGATVTAEVTSDNDATRTRARTAREVKALMPISPACHVTGCSGTVCSDQPAIITTCEWRQEYSCFQHARCERQRGGACGWTKTREYNSCVGQSRRP